MRLVWQGIKMQLMSELQYPVSIAMHWLTVWLAWISTYFFWQIAAGQGEIFGYSADQLAAYVLNVALMRGLVDSPYTAELATEIHHGRLSQWLTRPLDYLSYLFWVENGRKLWQLSLTIGQLVLISWWLRQFWWKEALWSNFLLILILVSSLSFHLSSLVSMLSFWWQGNPWSVRFFYLVLLELFSGQFFPLDVFPSSWRPLMLYQPLAFLVYWPSRWLSGQVSLLNWPLVALLGWNILSWYLSRRVWQAGLKCYYAWGS